jgi:hypothetical protein
VNEYKKMEAKEYIRRNGKELNKQRKKEKEKGTR